MRRNTFAFRLDGHYSFQQFRLEFCAKFRFFLQINLLELRPIVCFFQTIDQRSSHNHSLSNIFSDFRVGFYQSNRHIHFQKNIIFIFPYFVQQNIAFFRNSFHFFSVNLQAAAAAPAGNPQGQSKLCILLIFYSNLYLTIPGVICLKSNLIFSAVLSCIQDSSRIQVYIKFMFIFLKSISCQR